MTLYKTHQRGCWFTKSHSKPTTPCAEGSVGIQAGEHHTQRSARSFAWLAQLLRQLVLAAGTSETKEHILQHFQEVSSVYLCLLPGSSEGGAASSLQTPPSEARAPLTTWVSPSPSWHTRCSPSCGRAARMTTSGHGRRRTSELGKCPPAPLPAGGALLIFCTSLAAAPLA